MPRKPLIRSSSHPYHVTGRANNREKFHCSPELTWNIFCKILNRIQAVDKIKIHSFVLMPNHFHLLITVPEKDLGMIMKDLMQSVTKTMNALSGRSGRVFGGRYHQRLVVDLDYFDYVQKYIYRNPVKAGLVARVEDYRYSTIGVLLGTKKIRFTLSPGIENETCFPNEDMNEYLEWLNEPSPAEIEHMIRTGKVIPDFTLPALKWTKHNLNRCPTPGQTPNP